jgi:prephenate dehydrogenase
MTDIVEKLRHIGRIESSDPGMYKATHLTAGDALRAADEIESLRKTRDELLRSLAEKDYEIARLLSRIE